jgi:hypothetical protein
MYRSAFLATALAGLGILAVGGAMIRWGRKQHNSLAIVEQGQQE